MNPWPGSTTPVFIWKQELELECNVSHQLNKHFLCPISPVGLGRVCRHESTQGCLPELSQLKGSPQSDGAEQGSLKAIAGV